MFLPLNEHVEHFISDVFDFFMFNLMTEPLENRFLFSQVACMQIRRWPIEKTGYCVGSTNILPKYAHHLHIFAFKKRKLHNWQLVTFVEGRHSALEVDQSGHIFDAVLDLLGRTVDAHERDAPGVAFVVDVLQFGDEGQGAPLLLIIFRIYKECE